MIESVQCIYMFKGNEMKFVVNCMEKIENEFLTIYLKKK